MKEEEQMEREAETKQEKRQNKQADTSFFKACVVQTAPCDDASRDMNLSNCGWKDIKIKRTNF